MTENRTFSNVSIVPIIAVEAEGQLPPNNCGTVADCKTCNLLGKSFICGSKLASISSSPLSRMRLANRLGIAAISWRVSAGQFHPQVSVNVVSPVHPFVIAVDNPSKATHTASRLLCIIHSLFYKLKTSGPGLALLHCYIYFACLPCLLCRQALQRELHINLIPRYEYFAGCVFFGDA